MTLDPAGSRLGSVPWGRCWAWSTAVLGGSVIPCFCFPVPAQFGWSMEPLALAERGIPAGNSSSVAQGKFRVLVGVTGSVAALKLPLLVAELLKIPGVSGAL